MTMTREQQYEEEKMLYKTLGDKNNLFVTEIYHEKHMLYGDIVCILIEWGDWKHEHLRCDWLMQEMGYTFLGSETTEEDGSDTYSAIRRYTK